ncbi:hypothetical protein LE082_16600 [Escherichia coli]|nr:hypothetical protein [Escherichia coli]
MVIEYWLSNNAGGSVTANGIAGKVTIRQLAIFKNYIKCHSIWFLGVSLGSQYLILRLHMRYFLNNVLLLPLLIQG